MEEHPPEILAIFEKFPHLRKAFETGVESHDGREEALFSFIQNHVDFHNIQGNPTKLLETIDEFSFKHEFLISIGPHKAGIIRNLVVEQHPTTVVELGGYLGYSAILFAEAMRREQKPNEDLHVWSLEMSPEFAAIANKLIEIAGLSDIVTVVVGSAEGSLLRLVENGSLKNVNLLFLDHVEKLYVDDFKVCERLGILNKGAVIVADNVVRPGAPKYREYVRNHPGLKSEGVRGLIQPGDMEDELEISYIVTGL